MTETIHFCAPDWHDGERIAADYLLAVRDETNPNRTVAMFASCVEHIDRAVWYMLVDNPKVEVRRLVENYPCRNCGRTDLPLHVDYLCPDCHPLGT